VHSHGKTWAESYAAFVSPTCPPQPQIKATDSWLSLGSTLTQLQHFPIGFIGKVCSAAVKLPQFSSIAQQLRVTSQVPGETAHSALKKRDTNTHQHGWTALEHFSQANCEQENEDSDMKRVEPLASHGIPKSNGLSNVSRRLAFCGMFHGTN
jgi:hypothetical protein